MRTPLQRKERERRARRQEIIVAARRVFASKGYERATLDEIAERAEFAKGTLYNYFDSKETLFREIVSGMLDEKTAIARNAVEEGGSAREQFTRYAIRVFEYYRANEDLLRILIHETYRVQVEPDIAAIMKRVQTIAAVLGSALRQERNKRDTAREDPVELAHVFVGLIHNRAMRRALARPGLSAVDSEAEAKFLCALFFDGAARV